MADDTYDLMPHKQILELQKEVERLKRLPFGKGKTAKDLVDGLDSLNVSINKLIEIFETATRELVQEKPAKKEKVEKAVKKEEHPVLKKIEELTEQNKTIAQALLKVVDMVKEQKEEVKPISKKKEEVVKEPTRLKFRPIKPRFEELQPRPRFAPPMSTPEQPKATLPFEEVPTGAPIPPKKMAEGGLTPPMPEPIPQLPELPTIGPEEPAAKPEEKPKKKGLFHFK